MWLSLSSRIIIFQGSNIMDWPFHRIMAWRSRKNNFILIPNFQTKTQLLLKRMPKIKYPFKNIKVTRICCIIIDIKIPLFQFKEGWKFKRQQDYLKSNTFQQQSHKFLKEKMCLSQNHHSFKRYNSLRNVEKWKNKLY